MKANEIEKLLSRYYDGRTSEAEEKELKRFFTEEDVPTDLLSEKEFFMQWTKMPEPNIPENLAHTLDHLIDEWETLDRQKIKVNTHTSALRRQWIGRIAAGLLILLSAGTYLYNSFVPPVHRQDTCTTPGQAYEETRKALLTFSSALNRGMKQAEKMEQTTEKIQKSVYKQLERIKN